MPLIKLHRTALGGFPGEVFEHEFDHGDAEIAWYVNRGILTLAEDYPPLPIEANMDAIRSGTGDVRQRAEASDAQTPVDDVRQSVEVYNPKDRTAAQVVSHLDRLSEDPKNYLEIRRIINSERAGRARVTVLNWAPPEEPEEPENP